MIDVPLYLALAAIPAILLAWSMQDFENAVNAEKVRTRYYLMVTGHALTREAYRKAAIELSGADPSDSEPMIERSEFLSRSSDSATTLTQAQHFASEAVADAPADPRGWTLLCELDYRVRHPDAVRCFETGFFIAPFDWFAAGRRELLGSYLWSSLGLDVRDAVARRAYLIWQTNDLREVLQPLPDTPHGADLLRSAFKYDPQALRDFNRWLIQSELVRAAAPHESR